MISILLMVSVAVLLAVVLVLARRTGQRQTRLELENRAMQVELDRHRDVAHSILRELQSP
ncbi:MAG TPA: hypothetical protein VJ276_25535 [Thermoanaerobaculia bacterium]|nr:hypothetical protein [Thermoanaerobaculia bacterium]